MLLRRCYLIVVFVIAGCGGDGPTARSGPPQAAGTYTGGLYTILASLWSMLKRAHKDTFHKLSPKHLQRYVDEFAANQGIREMDTIDQMRHVVAGLVGRRLLYRDLTA